MADEEFTGGDAAEGLDFLGYHPEPLDPWTIDDQYRLFLVNITDTVPENLACEVYEDKIHKKRQATISYTDIIDILKHPPTSSHKHLNVKLNSKTPSIVVFCLSEPSATFETEVSDKNNASDVIQKMQGKPNLIYNAMWLKEPNDLSMEATDRKAVSVILNGRQQKGVDVPYGLRVHVKVRQAELFLYIDPMIGNDGEESDGGLSA